MHRFWHIQLVSIQWLWNPGYGSLKVIRTDTDRSAVYNFLLTFHSNHSLYCFWDKRRFQSKIANFPTSVYFVPPLKGFSLELGIDDGGQKTRTIGLPGWTRSLALSSALWIQCTNMTDKRARTDNRRQERPRLRIASRGKMSDSMRKLCALWQYPFGKGYMLKYR